MPEENEQTQQQPNNEGQLREEVARLSGKLGEYERMVLDPSYLEYLATRGRSGSRNPETQQEPDFDNMSQKDLVDYLKRYVTGTVNNAVVPLDTQAKVNATVADVK